MERKACWHQRIYRKVPVRVGVCVCARARAYVRGMRVRGQVPGSVSSCVAGRVRRFGRREISVNIKHGRRTESVQRQRSERQLDE